MENILEVKQQLNALCFRSTADVLTLRLHLLEMMTILTRHYKQVSNPVLRHHIQVTFYHLQQQYQQSNNTPSRFKQTKRTVNTILEEFLVKAGQLDTKTEYIPVITGAKTNNFRAVA